MPISGERRLIKASGRIGLWFSSLLVAGLLFSVLFGLIFGGAGWIFLIFRATGIGGFVAILFALIVGSLTTFFYYWGLKATLHRWAR
jgi:uncharacterized RDD family membrane protein YckC